MNGRKRPITILLVEDNPADVRLAIEALRESGTEHELLVASDGEMALAMLRQEGVYSDTPRPDLVLLDLNLPKRHGQEVLHEVKSDPALSAIPVVVLTTSRADDDVASAYRLHANSYIVKPVNLTRFMEIIESMCAYWFSTVTLPPS